LRALNQFIVRGERYANTRGDLIVSANEEDHRFSNREGEVIALPLGYDGPIAIGDTLLVHHNVFKYYNDMKGRQRSGRSFLRDDMFLVDFDQFYMYRSLTSGWTAHDRYCFVQPVPPQESTIFKPLTEEPLVGIMKYPNDYLSSQGIASGDTVTFKPESEYEFIVDGEKLYRMFDHQITCKIQGS
jgi:hypothetical protein